MTPVQKRLQTITTPTWVLLPLRLFLGITFIYAGIQKIMDPQFFNPQAHGYIGRQIAGFAINTPLNGFLTHIAAPHATAFGLLVILGEIAIGIGALFGLLLRPAAFFGFLLSLLFFLSASWHVYPYFYGADIVFAVCWLTLFLNGPLNTGYPSVDAWLTVVFFENAQPEQQARLLPALALIFGTVKFDKEEVPVQTTPLANKQAQARLVRNNTRGAQRALDARRNFLLGMLTGGVAAFGMAALGYAINVLRSGDTEGNAAATGVGASNTYPTPPPTAPASGTAATTASGKTIAQVSAVASNSALNFTIPSSGDAGVLVHLDNGQFVAYDALCTHAGCQVDYDPSSKLLVCPCHGAAFDPAKGAQVVNPPANTPLATVSIHIDSATGAITLAS